MNPLRPIFKEFSISWLRGYDFGLQHQDLSVAIKNLDACPIVDKLRLSSDPKEIDEVDKDLFDIRYQRRSKLIRVALFDSYIEDCSIGGQDRIIRAPLHCSLLIDCESNFGVFTLTITSIEIEGKINFSIEEITFLCKQWLLPIEQMNRESELQISELTLNVCLPNCETNNLLYIREVMNYYYLNIHRYLWRNKWQENFLSYDTIPIELVDEKDPQGFMFLDVLCEREMATSYFPTSFGPFLNIWQLDIPTDTFDKDSFLKEYACELGYILSDGRDSYTCDLELQSEDPYNPNRIFLIAPNHVIMINQTPSQISGWFINNRLGKYHVLDVDYLRILEILTLLLALYRAHDHTLDDTQKSIEKLDVGDRNAVNEFVMKRKILVRSIRRFNNISLFHTAIWQPVYNNLLKNQNLQLNVLQEQLNLKLSHLDDEIRQSILLQDRERQREQQEQELDVLRNLHTLSLTNEVQSDALMIINFVVSATASFAFTEVLIPWLTSVTSIKQSFETAFPGFWVMLNVGVFTFVAVSLYWLTSYLIRHRRPAIELEGKVYKQPYEESVLRSYVKSRKDLDYLHLDVDDYSGFLRVKKKKGIVLFQFDRNMIRRYIIFTQGFRDGDLEHLKWEYVDCELSRFPKPTSVQDTNNSS